MHNNDSAEALQDFEKKVEEEKRELGELDREIKAENQEVQKVKTKLTAKEQEAAKIKLELEKEEAELRELEQKKMQIGQRHQSNERELDRLKRTSRKAA